MKTMPVSGADLSVSPSIEAGLVVLTVDYGPEFLLPKGAPARLSEELRRAYEEQVAKIVPNGPGPSCVVEIKASVAGSSLVKGLFDLYKAVNARQGKLICAGYPKEYFNSLTALGLPKLTGFELAYSKGEALKKFGNRPA